MQIFRKILSSNGSHPLQVSNLIFINSFFKGFSDKIPRCPSLMDKEIEKKYLHTEKDVSECVEEKTTQNLVQRNNNNIDDGDTVACPRQEKCIQCQEYKEVKISWRRPDQGWVKINTDGAIHNGNAGCGGLIRGYKGEWVQGFTEKLGRVLSFEAELWGISNGLNLAWQHGCSNVIVETDNFSIAKQLSVPELRDKMVLHPISQIKDMLSRPWNVKIMYVYRESNKVADWLARYSLSQTRCLQIHDLPLPGIESFLLADAVGVATRRRIVADQEKWLEMDDAERMTRYLMDTEKLGRCVNCQKRIKYRQAMIFWSLPEQGWVKINTDGAMRNGNAGCGGLIRGDKGEWIQGFTQNLGSVTMSEAELWGVFNGLNLAWQHGFNNVILENNNEFLVRQLYGRKLREKIDSQPIDRIKDLFSRPWNVKVANVLKESNKVADWLATSSLNHDPCLKVHDLPPRGVEPLLLADAHGEGTPRMIRGKMKKRVEFSICTLQGMCKC